MPTTVADVQRAVDALWPASGAEAWDAVGLVAGSPDDEVRRILLAVDAVAATVDEAVVANADLLITHHPLLLRGVTSVAADRYKGSMLTRLIRGNVALLTAHTNADVVETGTSGTIAEALGLVGVTPIEPGPNPTRGIGRVGDLPAATTLGRFAHQLAELFPATASGIRVAGDFDRPIRRVALCGGAGDGLLAAPAVLGADVYVTSDLRHHPASEAIENATITGGPALVDVSHWASEWLWLSVAARELAAALPDVEIAVSDLRTDPWDFAIMQ